MIKLNNPIIHDNRYKNGQEINRLLTAAVVNGRFRSMLLNDPVSTATGGYAGEKFSLDNCQMKKLGAIRAATLAEFAAQLATI